MKGYLRFMARNRLYYIVEIVGISIAFAFTIPLLSFLEDKWSIDHGNSFRNVYAICPIGDFETTIGLGSKLSESIPGIEQYAQIYVFDESIVQVEDEILLASGLAVNAGFFDVFKIAFCERSLSSMVDRRSVFVSKSFASKIGTDVIGKTFFFNEEEYNIAGIFDDIHHSLLPPTDIIYSISSPFFDVFWKYPEGYWGDIFTLIKVKKGIKTRDLLEICESTCKDYYASYYSQHPDNQKDIKVIRYDKISSNINNYRLTQTWGLSLWAIELLGTIFLVFTSLNYINLTTALSLKRGKEWSMKKLLGLNSIKAFGSSFVETFFLSLLCFLAGYSLSYFVIPIFNNFFLATSTNIELSSAISPRKCIIYLFFIIILTAIASIIPTKIAGRYTPIDVVNGKYNLTIKSSTNVLLIGIQCFLTTILLSVSTLFLAQYKKMTNRPHGQLSDNVYVIHGNYTNESLDIAADALRDLPFILKVGKSNDSPGDGKYSRKTVKSPDGTSTPLYVLKCNKEAFEAFGFIINNHSTVYDGLWLSNGALESLTVHADELEYGIIDEDTSINVTGIMSDFVMRIDSDIESGVIVTESADFNRLIIKTVDNHCDYSDEIKETFEEAFFQANIKYIPPTESGYLEDFFQESIRPTESVLLMLSIYTLFSIVLGILGLIAMSINYVSQHQKEIAIRKVYGSSTRQEIARNIARYVRIILFASILGIIVSVMINGTIIQSYSYRISTTFWIYILVLIFIVGIAIISVYSQVKKTAANNPILLLRPE